MKRWIIFGVITLFLMGFISAGITTKAILNNSNDQTSNLTNNSDKMVVGGGCGTVSPDSRESCCKERGYDSWSDEKGTCEGLKSNEDNNSENEQEKNLVISAREENKLKEKIEISAELIGTQSKIKIDKAFYIASINLSDISTEIISKFAIDKDTANSLLKIETGEDEGDQEGINEEDRLNIEVNSNGKFARVIIEKKYVLNSTDREEILNSIVTESQLTADEIKNAVKMRSMKEVRKEEHRLKFENIQCPTNCECTGSVVRCEFENGTRIMTITAGKSGNIIVQVKGENMTTNVTLYKSGDKVYGVFTGNETREVKVLPDQVKEKIKAKIKARLENENITLDENGTYQYKAEKQARLFLVIPVKVEVKTNIDSETGTVSKVESPWWSALAKDE